MLRDLGSRDTEFMDTVKYIRRKLLEIANLDPDIYTAVPLQGSGTYAVESVFQTTVPRNGGKVFIMANGAYGKRMNQMASVLQYEKVTSNWYHTISVIFVVNKRKQSLIP